LPTPVPIIKSSPHSPGYFTIMTLFHRLRYSAQSILFITAISVLANTFAIDAAWAQDGSSGQSTTGAKTQDRKLILCLGGGGTRGASHIGMLRQLEKNHVKISGIVGTSIGALIGGLYCAGLTPDEIEDVLLSKALIRSYLTVPVVFRLVVAPFMYIPHAFGHHPYDGLYHGNRFATFINKKVAKLEPNRGNPNLDIEGLPIKFEAVCTDLLSAEAITINKGNLGRAIQASSAIPFLRRPVLMTKSDFKRLPGCIKDDTKDCYLLVDGGPTANLPTLQARLMADRMGHGFVLAVDTYGNFDSWSPSHFRKIGSSAERSLEVLLSSVEKKDLDKADMVVSPDVAGINLLSTSIADAQRAIEAGDQVGIRTVPQLLKRLTAN